MSRLHFIFNPVAGNGASKKAFAQMEELLRRQGIEYSVASSEYAGHALELTRQALREGHGCIVAVGGDGTVREVAQEMVDSGVPLGVLPCGTGNDMVRALHIPQDPAEALNILLDGEVRPMDAALANGKLFFNVGGFGFDVDVLINTDRYKKRFSGLTAYTMGLFRALIGLKLRRVRLITEEGEFESNALLVAACNGTHFGGGMNVAPLANPSDGLLDICVINDVTRRTVVFILMKFIKGQHLNLPIVRYFKAKEITVYSDPESRLQLDGEVVGETPVTFSIRPAALLVKAGNGMNN